MWKPGNWWTYFGRKAYKKYGTSLSKKPPLLRSSSLTVSITFHKLVLYKPIVEFMLNDRQGTVGRHLHRTANRITQLAKLQVGKKTGRLARSIKFEHMPKNALGPGVKVGAYTSYALLHHQGTKPHIILPRKPGGSLVFTRGARIVHTRIVRHPGTKANRYLTDPMRKVVLSGR